MDVLKEVQKWKQGLLVRTRIEQADTLARMELLEEEVKRLRRKRRDYKKACKSLNVALERVNRPLFVKINGDAKKIGNMLGLQKALHKDKGNGKPGKSLSEGSGSGSKNGTGKISQV